jgi:hypothetical protein
VRADLDVTERYVGVIAGYGNTLGTCASWVGPQLVAAQLHFFGAPRHPSSSSPPPASACRLLTPPLACAGPRWDIVLGTVAACNVLAAANYARHAIVQPIEHMAVVKRRK